VLFDSPVYLAFLALVVVLYWRLGWRRQNLFLLAASYFFYGWWDWRFLALMLTSTLVDYNFGLKIADSPNPRDPRAYPAAAQLAPARSGLVGPPLAWQTEMCAAWPAAAARI